jgi:hypothetical protein
MGGLQMQWVAAVPLDFISCVHTWISSCISSGATSLRDHESSHRGFGFATGSAWSPYLPALEAERGPSLDLKTFLKNGMLGWRGEPQKVPGGMRYQRQTGGGGGVAWCGVVVMVVVVKSTRADVSSGRRVGALGSNCRVGEGEGRVGKQHTFLAA